MDIVIQRELEAELLDLAARLALGGATSGVSSGGGLSRVHLAEANPPDQARASDLLRSFGALEVASSASAFQQGGPAPVLSSSDPRLAADGELACVVLRGGQESSRGYGKVKDGAFSLSLRQLVPGAYTVLLQRTRGDYASGVLRFRVDKAS